MRDGNKNGTTHGKHGTTLYKKWKSMRGRVGSHPHYIKQGIKCCPEWNKYVVFEEWALSNGYKDGLTLDRVDTYSNYCPENCRWATKYVQSSNIKTRKDNTSGYGGVSFESSSGKYKVQIQINGNKVYLGRYITAIEGALAFDSFVIDNNLPHSLNFGDNNEK